MVEDKVVKCHEPQVVQLEKEQLVVPDEYDGDAGAQESLEQYLCKRIKRSHLDF